MPKVFDWDGYRFHFFANEGYPREPMHVHVSKPDVEAKFWLYPEVQLAYNHGYDARTIKRLNNVVQERRDQIRDMWNDFFS